MTLDEARRQIGNAVIYLGYIPEIGVITSVNDSYVFVRYGSDTGSKATRAEHLRALSLEQVEP